ncbi:ubiquinone biosynthesis protein COQ9 [Coniochaeta ligniaria NRRL 30616]|uniref:Ubiquinone biosynthesis protein n=1 Tax=Coniochaeta ligniaria NRRL 30616 TaxID=1408157 RepID=A0A1J7JAP8_9PEZI|nr:ubiquinone biosynthesis protein COQ9 [Coniochaeta ligniaria NRRL 30616]
MSTTRCCNPRILNSPEDKPKPKSSSATSSSKMPARSFHSYDHPPPPGPFNETERAILSAAYAHVPQHGFTSEALALGARDAGYLDISTNLLPNGSFDLIRWHLVTRRDALVQKSKELEAAGMRTGDKVFALTWERLMGNRDVLVQWQEALAIMAQPSYVPASLKELAQLVDDIWFLSGDTAVDPSWYTKRASLSAIYVGAELFMTNDRSPDFADTRAFLRRRFDEVGEFGSALGSVGEWLSFTASAGVNVLRSKGAPI